MKISRIAKIAQVFAEEGLGYITDAETPRQAGNANQTDAERNPTSPDQRSETSKPARLRKVLEKLGPTFVKFGQILANRLDILPPEYSHELLRLQSNVSTFPTIDAFNVIETQLARPISDLFESISQEPIGSASIAQVYKATLKSGYLVAVKVQRPNMEETLLEDLQILLTVSGWLTRLFPPYKDKLIHELAREYVTQATKELDFLQESLAIEEFYDTYSDDAFFLFPKVHREFCTGKILVMQWFEGKSLDKIPNPASLEELGINHKVLAQNLLRLQIEMSYEKGLLHGDMHGGNLIVLPNGKIGIIDFGLHTKIPKTIRLKVLEILLYQSQNRLEEQVKSIIEFAPPKSESLHKAYADELRLALSKSIQNSNHSISNQIIETIKIGAKFGSQSNSSMLMIFRNLMMIEGHIHKFSPDLNIKTEFSQIISNIMGRQFSPFEIKKQFEPVIGDISLNLMRRPELLQKLLKLERTFVESKNLGEFFKKEGLGVVFENKNSHPVIPTKMSLFFFSIGAITMYITLKLMASM